MAGWSVGGWALSEKVEKIGISKKIPEKLVFIKKKTLKKISKVLESKSFGWREKSFSSKILENPKKIRFFFENPKKLSKFLKSLRRLGKTAARLNKTAHRKVQHDPRAVNTKFSTKTSSFVLKHQSPRSFHAQSHSPAFQPAVTFVF